MARGTDGLAVNRLRGWLRFPAQYRAVADAGRQRSETGNQMAIATMVERERAELACAWRVLRMAPAGGARGGAMRRVRVMPDMVVGGMGAGLFGSGHGCVLLGAPLPKRRTNEQHGDGEYAQPAAQRSDPAWPQTNAPCPVRQHDRICDLRRHCGLASQAEFLTRNT